MANFELARKYSNGSVADYPEYAMILSFLVGAITFLLGFFRLGFLDSVFSRPVVSALVFAIAVTVASTQLDSLFGVTPCPTTQCPTTLDKVSFTIRSLIDFNANLYTTAIGLSALTLLFWMQWIKAKYSSLKYVPHVLIIVIICTLLSWKFDLAANHVKVLGHIVGTLQNPRWPLGSRALFDGKSFRFDFLVDCVEPAISISIISFIQVIVISQQYAMKYSYPVSANREVCACLSFSSICISSCCFFSPRSLVFLVPLSFLVSLVFLCLCCLFLLRLF